MTVNLDRLQSVLERPEAPPAPGLVFDAGQAAEGVELLRIAVMRLSHDGIMMMTRFLVLWRATAPGGTRAAPAGRAHSLTGKGGWSYQQGRQGDASPPPAAGGGAATRRWPILQPAPALPSWRPRKRVSSLQSLPGP